MTSGQSIVPGFRPLAGNPFRTRSDVADALHALFRPLRPCYSAGGARLRLASGAARFDEAAAELEGFSRVLWGLVPLAAGGGKSDAWELVRRGLASGTDPDHPEFWGWTEERDQRMVEMAAIGFALALVPELVWEPLDRRARDNLVRWLVGINAHETVDNNWRFFRVLVNLGLRRVDGPWDRKLTEDACAKLDRFYLGDGWYRDGERPQLDYYVAFASHWFGDAGAAIPFGRSLTYRFAQGAFWGALAFADVEALPWGEAKGLYLRHLRWWSDKPIADRDGVLTIGYGYANLLMSEDYNSPQSPYWAMKAFLPLAVSDKHPFWAASELPNAAPSRSVQKHPGLILERDATHAVMLSSGQSNRLARQGTAKYSKFAYSSRFGFSIESGWGGVDYGCYDSMLAIAYTDAPDQYRVRESLEASAVEERWLYSRWLPWPEVEVESWLIPVGLPWLLRVHRLVTRRPILTKEAGFAADRTGATHADREYLSATKDHQLRIDAAGGIIGIRDLGIAGGNPQRLAATSRPLPNTNLVHSRTIAAMLLGRHEIGRLLLATAVFATIEIDVANRMWDRPPTVPAGPWLDG